MALKIRSHSRPESFMTSRRVTRSRSRVVDDIEASDCGAGRESFLTWRRVTRFRGVDRHDVDAAHLFRGSAGDDAEAGHPFSRVVGPTDRHSA